MKKLYRIQIYYDTGYVEKEMYIKMTSEEARIINAFIAVCELTNDIKVDTMEDLKLKELFNE